MIIEVDKKYFIGIVAVMLIIAGAFFVVSYNVAGSGGVPSDFGHSADELELTGVCRTDGTDCPPPPPEHVSGGLYGICKEYYNDETNRYSVYVAILPAKSYPNRGTKCSCAGGYSLVETGWTGGDFTYYSCIKD